MPARMRPGHESGDASLGGPSAWIWSRDPCLPANSLDRQTVASVRLQRSWTCTAWIPMASTTYMGMNALHAASGRGRLPAYQYLVEEVKMDINEPDTSQDEDIFC